MEVLQVDTTSRCQMIDLTDRVQAAVQAAGLKRGLVGIFVPHTTAGITINENADPDVAQDMLRQLEQMVPQHQNFYRHAEGDSAAHLKASMVGSSVIVIVEQETLRLGRWQGLCCVNSTAPAHGMSGCTSPPTDEWDIPRPSPQFT